MQKHSVAVVTAVMVVLWLLLPLSAAPVLAATSTPRPAKECHVCQEEVAPLFTPTPTPPTPTTWPVTVYFFWGDGCPHCAAEKPFLEKLSQQAAIEVRAFEVWNSPQNRDLFYKVAASLGFEPRATPAPKPIVRAVLFWMDGCPHCHEVINNVLPPLQKKYGDQLNVHLIEVKSQQDVDSLYQLGVALNIPKQNIGVPFLVIGDKVLIGSAQIPAELPGLIEQYLAAGGVDYPNLPGLADLLQMTTPQPTAAQPQVSATTTAAPAAVAQSSRDAPPPASFAAQPVSEGFELAIGIMAGMVVALVYAGATFGRAWHAKRGRAPRVTLRVPAWTDALTPVLTIIGLGVAGYLAYVETQAVPAVCGPVGDCNAVQASSYARLLGVLPVGLLGVAGYAAILAAWLRGRLRSDRLADYAPLSVLGMTVFGVLFSLYLTYLEPFVIKAVCAWCLTSAVIMTLLMLLSIGPAVQSIERE